MSGLHRLLQSIQRVLTPLLEWTVITLVVVLVLDVLWGVFTRFVMQSPSRWTEEVARLLLIWVSLLGAAVAFQRREHLGFDYVVKQLDPAAQRLLALVAQCVVIAFTLAVLVYGGYVLVSETLEANQVTPALGIRMGHVYLALPLSGFFIVLYCFDQLLELALAEPADDRLPDSDSTAAR